MNIMRELKQQEKYKNMLKRKNKEKNIYKIQNETLRIKYEGIKRLLEKKDKEIERLNNIINEFEEDIKNYREILEQGITDKVDYIYLGSVLQFLDNSLDKLHELKGSDK